MNWVTAANQSLQKAATRLDRQGRAAFRYLDGTPPRIQDESRNAYRDAFPWEVDGFDDWEPAAMSR